MSCLSRVFRLVFAVDFGFCFYSFFFVRLNECCNSTVVVADDLDVSVYSFAQIHVSSFDLVLSSLLIANLDHLPFCVTSLLIRAVLSDE